MPASATGRDDEGAVQQAVSPEELRALYGEPNPRVLAKQLSRLDAHARRFIALSPFLVIASADRDGHCDATPRGDAPGFVAVLDERRLAVPDRIGNRRIDTLTNVAANPRVGLLFVVPGIDETLRVNGRAGVSREPELLAALAARGRAPVSALVVDVEEVFFHCGKAMMRSRLWDPDSRVPRADFPTLGRILADQIPGDLSPDAAEAWIADSYADRLY